MADNPVGVVVPPGLAYELEAINRRRMMAQALRELGAQPSRTETVASGASGGGMVLPNLGLEKLGNTLDANRMSEQADADQARAVSAYESRLKNAMGGIAKYADPLGGGSLEDVAGAAGEAAAAGVPKEVYEAVMNNRGDLAMLNSIMNGGMLGGASRAPAERPGSRGGASGGGGMGFLPSVGGGAPSGPPGASAAAPGGVPESLTGTTKTGSPFQDKSEGELLTLISVGAEKKSGPLAVASQLAKNELAAREVKVEQGSGLVTRMGKPVGVLKDGIYTDLASNRTIDMQGAAKAAQAGQVTDAQEAAKAKRDVITVTQGGKPRQLTRAQFIAATQGDDAVPAQTDAAGTDARAVAALRANGGQTVSYTPDGRMVGSGGGGDLGVGLAPETQEGRTELAKGATALLNSGLDNAQKAANVNIPQIYEARQLLDSGKVSTGMGSNIALQFGRALSATGLSDGDGVAATQAFVAEAGKRVMGVIKMLGSGSGISDADREYAAKATGGDIKLDEKSIRRILDIDERAQRAVIAAHAKNVQKGASFFGSPEQRAFYEVAMPDAYKRAGAQESTPGGRRVVNFADLPP